MLRRRVCLGLAVAASISPNGELRAGTQESVDTIRPEEAVAEALRANPRIRAARLRAGAAAERVSPSSALPDPALSVGLMNRSVHGFSTEPMMAVNAVQLSQRFPWPGVRGSSERRVESLARAEALDAEELEASIAGRVLGSYYRIAFLDRAVETMRSTSEILRNLREVAGARYEVGEAIQQDVLSAQVALARMEADIRVMRQRRVGEAARFNALLGREPDRLLGPLLLPALPDAWEGGAGALGADPSARPALLAAGERVEAARWARDVADRGHLPDLNVTVGYGQRPRYDDLLTLMVGVTLPVRRGSLQEPRRREAQALEAAAEAVALDVRSETYAALVELGAVASRAHELATLYATSIVPQARAAVEAGLSAYRVGTLDFRAVLESQMDVNEYEIERARLVAEFHGALASIDAWTGTLPGGER